MSEQGGDIGERLYAFLTLTFDPSFTGESGGETRSMTSPDLNVEDFQAAIDYLSNLDEVNPDKLAIIGICGWGCMEVCS